MRAVGYIGDGRLFALTNGANLQYLCGYDGTSFLSLQTGLSLYSRHENGMMVHKNHALSHFDGKVEITDLSFDGCFVRHSETTRSLTYRLQFPPYCHLYEYPPLKVGGQGLPLLLIVIPAGVPKPEGGATQNERRLLMTVLGDATLSSDKKQLCLCPGRSTLLFALGVGVLCCVAPFLLYTLGMETLDNGRAAVLATLEPAVASLIGFFILREAATPMKLAGILLIFAGILLLSLPARSKRKEG